MTEVENHFDGTPASLLYTAMRSDTRDEGRPIQLYSSDTSSFHIELNQTKWAEFRAGAYT